MTDEQLVAFWKMVCEQAVKEESRGVFQKLREDFYSYLCDFFSENPQWSVAKVRALNGQLALLKKQPHLLNDVLTADVLDSIIADVKNNIPQIREIKKTEYSNDADDFLARLAQVRDDIVRPEKKLVPDKLKQLGTYALEVTLTSRGDDKQSVASLNNRAAQELKDKNAFAAMDSLIKALQLELDEDDEQKEIMICENYVTAATVEIMNLLNDGCFDSGNDLYEKLLKFIENRQLAEKGSHCYTNIARLQHFVADIYVKDNKFQLAMEAEFEAIKYFKKLPSDFQNTHQQIYMEYEVCLMRYCSLYALSLCATNDTIPSAMSYYHNVVNSYKHFQFDLIPSEYRRVPLFINFDLLEILISCIVKKAAENDLTYINDICDLLIDRLQQIIKLIGSLDKQSIEANKDKFLKKFCLLRKIENIFRDIEGSQFKEKIQFFYNEYLKILDGLKQISPEFFAEYVYTQVNLYMYNFDIEADFKNQINLAVNILKKLAEIPMDARIRNHNEAVNLFNKYLVKLCYKFALQISDGKNSDAYNEVSLVKNAAQLLPENLKKKEDGLFVLIDALSQKYSVAKSPSSQFRASELASESKGDKKEQVAGPKLAPSAT